MLQALGTRLALIGIQKQMNYGLFVKIEDNKPVSYDIFAEGWLQGSLSWGRPVDLEVMKDGSLLISDDKAGLIYRVIYEKENK
ncbi:MAG: hypothetical protein IBX41_08285 [Methanophagales archaeon]|nr:hypothetical protein [Methanophagales archaeon]